MTANLGRLSPWPLAILPLAVAVGLVAGVDPRYGVVLALGVAYVVVCLLDLSAGVAAFAFLTFLDPSQGIPAPVGINKLSGLVVLLAWVALVATRGDDVRRFYREHPRAFGGLLAFLGWTALSSTWAERSGDALTAVTRYGLNFALFLLVYTAARDRRDLWRLMGAYVAGAVVATLYGVAAGTPNTGDAGRLTGTVGDPNELASVLVPAIPVALALAAGRGVSPWRRLLLCVAAVVCLLGIMLTVSRGGLVALGAALAAAVLFGGRWRAKAGIAAGMALAAVVLYFAAFATPAARQRVLHPGGGTGREDLWHIGLRMVDRHPVRGIGADNFSTSSVHYLLEPGLIKRSDFVVEKPKPVHNTYLGVLAELGAVGGAVFLAIVVFPVVCVWRARRIFAALGRLDLELVAYGVLVGMLGQLVADAFLTANYNKQLWLVLSFGPALLAIAQAHRPRRAPASAA